jgi:ABC-2 type transport system permease protein
MHGNFEIGARIVMQGFFSLIGLGIGVGLGFIAWQIASHNTLRLLAALLWPVFVIWQFVPITIASFQENADLSIFLRFPLDFGSYFLFYIVFGLFDVSSLVGGIALLGILIGASIAQHSLFLWMAFVLALFTLFNVLLTRMIFSWIDRWLAQRRTREILGVVFLFLILGLQLLNPAFYRHDRLRSQISHATMMQGFQVAERAQDLLPPGLAANAISSVHNGKPLAAALNVFFLLLYAAAAGALLAIRLRAEYRGESLGEAPSLAAKKTRARSRPSLFHGSGPIAAVIEKEIRYLMRSGVMLYGFLAPLVIVFLFSGGSHAGRSSGFAGQYALPLGVAYSFLGLTRFIYNNLGGEGAGIQLYFLSPTPFRKIILAKNIVHIMIFLVELLLICAIVGFRVGMPGPQILAITFCWLLFALPAQLAMGNIISITMPYRLNMTRMSREQGAAANSLLSLLVELLVFAAGAAVFILLKSIGHTDLVAPVLLVLAAGSILLWMRVLSNSADMVQARQESLIAALYKAA